jgi:putative transposase
VICPTGKSLVRVSDAPRLPTASTLAKSSAPANDFRELVQSDRVVQSLNRIYWQRRFWEHAIRDDADLERHIDYIHFNPVKHGKVTRVLDWPHSSFHRFVERGLLPSDWGGDLKDIAGSIGE